MAEPATAEITHTCPGRVRLRLPDARRHPDRLEHVRRHLSALEGVDEVRVNPETGSVLVLGTVAIEKLAAHALRQQLFALRTEAPEVGLLLDEVIAWVGRISDGTRRLTGGRLDLATVTALAFAGMGLVQLVRGRVAVPAMTYLWWAVGAAVMARTQRAPD